MSTENCRSSYTPRARAAAGHGASLDHDHVKDVLYFSPNSQGPQTENVYAATGTITPYLSPVVCVVGMWGWRDARLPLHSCRSCTGTLIGEEGSSHPLSALSLWGGGLNASSLLSLSLSLQSRVSSAPWFSRTAWRRCDTTHGATAPQPRPTARVRTRAPTRSPVTWGAGMWAMHVLSLCSVTARTAPLGYPCMHARAMHTHAGAIVAILVVRGGGRSWLSWL